MRERGARAGVTGRGHRGRRWRGGTGGHGLPAACVLQGRGRGHEGGGGGVPGKEIGSGAHPIGGVSVGQWGGASWWRSTVGELAQWSPMTGP
jgi:hypothetical protein